MNNRECMEREISIKDLISFVLWNGRICLIAALAVMALLCGYKMSTLPEIPEEVDAAKLLEYEKDKAELTKGLETAKRTLANHQEYCDNTLLMQIDPYNKYTTQISFAISDIDATKAQEAFAPSETPYSYMSSRVQAQYTALWNGLDLARVFSQTSCRGIPDKYLREIVTFKDVGGGVFTIDAIGRTETESRQLANSMYQYFEAHRAEVGNASFPHAFALLGEGTTKVQIDHTLEETQIENENKIDTYQTNVEDAEKALEDLKEPSIPDQGSHVKTFVKWCIIGLIVGGGISAFGFFMCQLFNSRITGSEYIRTNFSLPFLGSLSSRGNFWQVLSRLCVGEYTWKEQKDALDYIIKCGAVHLPETGEVAIVSTCKKFDSDIVATLAHALSTPERSVRFAGNVAHSAEALEIVRQCEGVVLAEQACRTKDGAIAETIELAELLKKQVYGFYLM